MSRPSWAPTGIDLTRPSAARVYDYYLGGSHNFEVDRQMAQQAIGMWPELPAMMQSNRAFLRRAVSYLSDQGVTQFLDIGSGIPTAGNVHEVVHQHNPDGRVVYVDNDPVAAAHSRAILEGAAGATVVEADFRRGSALLEDPGVQSLIDLDQPVALLLVALLHFVSDGERPHEMLKDLTDRLASGSYLVISHASTDGQPELASSHQQLYQRTPTPMSMRGGAEIARFFEGFEMVSPGLVRIPLWRPDDPAAEAGDRTVGYAGVGRKP